VIINKSSLQAQASSERHAHLCSKRGYKSWWFCFDILMPQEFLNRADIVVVLQKLCGKAMAKSMTTDSLVDTCQTSS
jgi:hypothetical protein